MGMQEHPFDIQTVLSSESLHTPSPASILDKPVSRLHDCETLDAVNISGFKLLFSFGAQMLHGGKGGRAAGGEGGSAEGGEHKSTRNPDKRRRNRVPVSCFSCRALKTKCDGIRPTCATCAHSGRTCTYLQQGISGSGRGTETVVVSRQ